MQRRLSVLVLVLVALVVTAAAVALAPPDSPAPDGEYPAGAGPDHVNFSALGADGANVSHTPRAYWDSYAITYTAPPERRLVEGEYYIDSATGEIVADRWHGATVYRNGSTYAVVQPADRLPEREREELDADPAYVYDDATGAYYRYDPHYGRLAPTNIGRHTMILGAYTWTARNRTTHHGVPVVTYRVTGTRSDARDVPPAVDGTLELGAEDGIVYAYDLTLETDDETYRYAYAVKPAPFPDHAWVERARTVAANGSREA